MSNKPIVTMVTTVKEQVKYISGELNEIKAALYDNHLADALRECGDVILATKKLAHNIADELGIENFNIGDVLDEVIKENTRRGYYKESNSSDGCNAGQSDVEHNSSSSVSSGDVDNCTLEVNDEYVRQCRVIIKEKGVCISIDCRKCIMANVGDMACHMDKLLELCKKYLDDRGLAYEVD